MNLSLIVAVSENDVIGHQGTLPWHLSSDLKRFKQLTMGHHIIMGRRTFESIGRLLPGRTTVILTRQQNYHVPDAVIAADVERVLDVVKNDDEPFVVGGSQVYCLCLPHVTKMYVTRVHAAIKGDRHLSSFDWSQWKLTGSISGHSDDCNDYEHTFETYQRKCPVAVD